MGKKIIGLLISVPDISARDISVRTFHHGDFLARGYFSTRTFRPGYFSAPGMFSGMHGDVTALGHFGTRYSVSVLL